MLVSRTNRMSPVLAAIIALSLLAPAAVAQTVTGPLSLADALDLASRNNGDFQAQLNQLRSAEWGLRSAYGSLMPSVNASTGFGYTASGERRAESVVLAEQPAMYSSRYSLGMSLSLNGSTFLAPSVARAQVRATEQQIEGSAANLHSDVTQRYLSVLEARDAAAQAERELERTNAHVALAAARFEIGAGTRLDVSRAEVQRGQAEVRLVQARNTAANEVLLLSQSIGTRLPVDIELSERFELFEPMWTLEQLRTLALGENPTLQASRAQADAATTRARAARSSYLPTISLSAGLSGYVSQAGNIDPLVQSRLGQLQSSYSGCLRQNEILTRVDLPTEQCFNPDSPEVRSAIREAVAGQNQGFPFGFIGQPASASLSISLPIFTGFNRQQQIEEANIGRLNAQHQVRTQELRVEVEIETALRNLETAYQTALLQSRVREMAQEELQLAEERFRFGATTSVEVVDAQASLAESERAEIAAVFAFHRSLAALEARTGGTLDR